MTLTRDAREAFFVVAQALSLVASGALLGGWTSWTILPTVPAILLGLWDVRIGLCVGALLEMAALHRHGALAFVTLLGVVLLWSERIAFRAGAGLLLVLAGWLGRAQAATRWATWAAGGVTLIYVAREVIVWNK
jgi:hypothetical protein